MLLFVLYFFYHSLQHWKKSASHCKAMLRRISGRNLKELDGSYYEEINWCRNWCSQRLMSAIWARKHLLADRTTLVYSTRPIQIKRNWKFGLLHLSSFNFCCASLLPLFRGNRYPYFHSVGSGAFGLCHALPFYISQQDEKYINIYFVFLLSIFTLFSI